MKILCLIFCCVIAISSVAHAQKTPDTGNGNAAEKAIYAAVTAGVNAQDAGLVCNDSRVTYWLKVEQFSMLIQNHPANVYYRNKFVDDIAPSVAICPVLIENAMGNYDLGGDLLDDARSAYFSYLLSVSLGAPNFAAFNLAVEKSISAKVRFDSAKEKYDEANEKYIKATVDLRKLLSEMGLWPSLPSFM